MMGTRLDSSLLKCLQCLDNSPALVTTRLIAKAQGEKSKTDSCDSGLLSRLSLQWLVVVVVRAVYRASRPEEFPLMLWDCGKKRMLECIHL